MKLKSLVLMMTAFSGGTQVLAATSAQSFSGSADTVPEAQVEAWRSAHWGLSCPESHKVERVSDWQVSQCDAPSGSYWQCGMDVPMYAATASFTCVVQETFPTRTFGLCPNWNPETRRCES